MHPSGTPVPYAVHTYTDLLAFLSCAQSGFCDWSPMQDVPQYTAVFDGLQAPQAMFVWKREIRLGNT